MPPRKRHVAILIPFRHTNRGVFVFLQKRATDAKRLPGYFGFWGGGIESGETPEEALQREMREELGLNLGVLRYEFFRRYEFPASVKYVSLMPVDDTFEPNITILEGDSGKFFDERAVMKERKLIQEDKQVLRDVFHRLTRAEMSSTSSQRSRLRHAA